MQSNPNRVRVNIGEVNYSIKDRRHCKRSRFVRNGGRKPRKPYRS